MLHHWHRLNGKERMENKTKNLETYYTFVFVNKDECKHKNIWNMDEIENKGEKMFTKRENVYCIYKTF